MVLKLPKGSVPTAARQVLPKPKPLAKPVFQPPERRTAKVEPKAVPQVLPTPVKVERPEPKVERPEPKVEAKAVEPSVELPAEPKVKAPQAQAGWRSS